MVVVKHDTACKVQGAVSILDEFWWHNSCLRTMGAISARCHLCSRADSLVLGPVADPHGKAKMQTCVRIWMSIRKRNVFIIPAWNTLQYPKRCLVEHGVRMGGHLPPFLSRMSRNDLPSDARSFWAWRDETRLDHEPVPKEQLHLTFVDGMLTPWMCPTWNLEEIFYFLLFPENRWGKRRPEVE